MELTLQVYQTREGVQPYARWFLDLNAEAMAKVLTALTRLQAGNVSNVKHVGEGVLELKIAFGPGYRVYFGKHGDQIVILLGGGTKARQDRDIAAAHARWADYKQRTRTTHE